MKAKPRDLVQNKYNESALVWDESQGKWIVGYEKSYKRTQSILFLDNVVFDSANETYTSQPFECPAYEKVLMLMKIASTGTPGRVIISVEFSDDGISFHKFVENAWGDMRYKGDVGTLLECVSAPVIAKYMRIYAESASCDSSNYYTVKTTGIFGG